MDKYSLAALINKTSTRAVIIATGGGTGIFPLLLERGGGSSTLLSGMIPYAQEETIGIMAGKPDKFVSEQTARSLAMAAYMKALKLRTEDYPVVGLACTASLQTIPASEEREGRKHSIFVAMQTATKTVAVTFEIEQYKPPKIDHGFSGYMDTTGIFYRQVEEEQCVLALLNLLAEGCDLECEPATSEANLKFTVTRKEREDEVFGKLLAKSLSKVVYPGKGGENPKIIFPGSFNPVHKAHLEMVDIIRNKENLRDKTIGFEISMFNVDKPPVDFISLRERVEQFEALGETVIITNAPTFIEKSNMFPHKSFIVGYDTAVRILDPRYAGPIDKVIDTFKRNDNYFYIFPRQHMESFSLPGEYITEKREFEYLSSSKIRKEAKK